MFDHRVGGFENIAGGAIVLLKSINLGIGKILREALDIFDFCPAPTVDRLVVVTDGGYTGRFTGKYAQPRVLYAIRVLKFVYQHKWETLLIMFENMGLVQPEFVGAQENFSKIHHAAALAVIFVGAINLQHGAHKRIAAVLNMLRAQAFIFLAVDIPLRLFMRPFVFVDIERLINALDQSQLVVAVQNLEVLRQFCILPMGF